MAQTEQVTEEMRCLIVKCCNKDIVPDPSFNPSQMFHSEWFENFFAFIDNKKLQKHLGEAFYQARLNYELMNVLRLTAYKAAGIVKFQIIQYASIYEAILDYVLDKYFDTKAAFSYPEYSWTDNCISKGTKIIFNGDDMYVCRKIKKTQKTKFARIDKKTDFAVANGVISQSLRDKVCSLYDTRNNVHLLKAYDSDYMPKVDEAKNAFKLMYEFVAEIQKFLYSKRNPLVVHEA